MPFDITVQGLSSHTFSFVTRVFVAVTHSFFDPFKAPYDFRVHSRPARFTAP